MKMEEHGLFPFALGCGRQPENDSLIVGAAGPGGAVKITGAVHDQASVWILAVRSAAGAVRKGVDQALSPAAVFVGRQLEDSSAPILAKSAVIAATALESCAIKIARRIENYRGLGPAAVVRV